MNENSEYLLSNRLQFGMPHPPFSEEHAFYDIVARGDTDAICELKRLYGDTEGQDSEKGRLSENPLRNAVYHLVVNCTIITRCCISAGMPQEEAYTLSDIFIRQADRCKSVEQVRKVNDDMSMEFAERMKKIHESPNLSPAVRKAVNFIRDNLGKKLTTSVIAEKTGYNRCYMSTLFKKETGATISEYILTRRIEAACSMIKDGVSLSEISEALGFSSQSHFGVQFRRTSGLSPKEYRNLCLTGK